MKKVDLTQLKVKSFMTSLDQDNKQAIRGGLTNGRICATDMVGCSVDFCASVDICQP